MKTIMLDHSDKPAIDRLRAKARRNFLCIEKSRQQIHCDNRGGLRLSFNNEVWAGYNFDLDLEEAEYWIDEFSAKAKWHYAS